jgi:hypothetical protein
MVFRLIQFTFVASLALAAFVLEPVHARLQQDSCA